MHSVLFVQHRRQNDVTPFMQKRPIRLTNINIDAPTLL